MTETNKIELKEFLILCIFYLTLVIGTGLYRINLMTDILDKDIVQIAKLSGTISMVLTSLFSVITIFLIGFICKLIIDIFSFSLNSASLTRGLMFSVFTLVCFEVLKFFNAYLFLEESIKHIHNDEDLIEEIIKTRWHNIDQQLSKIMLFVSSIFFAFGLGKNLKMNKGSLFEVILISVVFLIGFYLSTIKLL
jgi:hypothetical protein